MHMSGQALHRICTPLANNATILCAEDALTLKLVNLNRQLLSLQSLPTGS